MKHHTLIVLSLGLALVLLAVSATSVSGQDDIPPGDDIPQNSNCKNLL